MKSSSLLWVLLLAGPAVIRADEAWPSGNWSGDKPAVTTGTGHVTISGDTLTLSGDGDATFTTTGLNAAKSRRMPTLAIESTGKAVTLQGPLSLGNYAALNVTCPSSVTLTLSEINTTQAGPSLNPISGNVSIGKLTTNVKLAGTTTGNTLGLFTGGYFQQDSGTWTVTGDNSAGTWAGGVTGGTLVLAPGASLGKGPLSVNSTFAPGAGTSFGGSLHMHNGSHLDMADGKVGTFNVTGQFSGPNGGSVYLHFDVSPEGVDTLAIDATSSTNDIKDYVVLNILPGKLKPGTYTLVTLAKGNIIENHLGFDFTGDPANHDHIIKSKTMNGYTFILNTLDASGKATNYQGVYAVYTLTIAEAAP